MFWCNGRRTLNSPLVGVLTTPTFLHIQQVLYSQWTSQVPTLLPHNREHRHGTWS